MLRADKVISEYRGLDPCNVTEKARIGLFKSWMVSRKGFLIVSKKNLSNNKSIFQMFKLFKFLWKIDF